MFKNFPSFYFINYNSIISFSTFILLFLFQIEFKKNYYFDFNFLLINIFEEFYFILILSICFINVFLHLSNLISKTFYNIDTNSKSFVYQYFSLFILFLLNISTIAFNIVFFDDDESKFGILCFNILNFIFHFLILIPSIYFFYDYINFIFTSKNIKKIKSHWIDDYLNQKDRNNKVCLYYKDNIVGVFVKSIKLDISHKYNSVIFNGKDYNLNAFKTYLENKNCLVSDLTSDDLDVIDMLGIE